MAILRVGPAREQGEEDSQGEARVLYVAATRARESVYQLGREGLPIMLKDRQPSGRERWASLNREGQHHFQVGLQGDLDDESWVSRGVHRAQGQAEAVQRLIWEKLKPGTRLQVAADDVRLVLAWQSPKSGQALPLGRLDHDCLVDLAMFLRRFAVDGMARYPRLMREVVMIERTTVVLRPFAEDVLHEPWASSGFCLGLNVRVVVQTD